MVRGIPASPFKTVGQNIKRLREQDGISQRKLSQLSGISDRSISKWETGAGGITLTNAYRIAEALGVDIQALTEER